MCCCFACLLECVYAREWTETQRKCGENAQRCEYCTCGRLSNDHELKCVIVCLQMRNKAAKREKDEVRTSSMLEKIERVS